MCVCIPKLMRSKKCSGQKCGSFKKKTTRSKSLSSFIRVRGNGLDQWLTNSHLHIFAETWIGCFPLFTLVFALRWALFVRLGAADRDGCGFGLATVATSILTAPLGTGGKQSRRSGRTQVVQIGRCKSDIVHRFSRPSIGRMAHYWHRRTWLNFKCVTAVVFFLPARFPFGCRKRKKMCSTINFPALKWPKKIFTLNEMVCGSNFFHKLADFVFAVFAFYRSRTRLFELLWTSAVYVEFTILALIALWTQSPDYVLAVIAMSHLVVLMQCQLVPLDRYFACRLAHQFFEALLATHKVRDFVNWSAWVWFDHENAMQDCWQGIAERNLFWVLLWCVLFNFIPRI